METKNKDYQKVHKCIFGSDDRHLNACRKLVELFKAKHGTCAEYYALRTELESKE